MFKKLRITGLRQVNHTLPNQVSHLYNKNVGLHNHCMRRANLNSLFKQNLTLVEMKSNQMRKAKAIYLELAR